METAYLLRRGLYMPWELANFLDPDLVRVGWRELAPRLQLPPVNGKRDDFAAISALECTLYMRNMLLRDADWAGMAHSVEIRVPFVDLEFLNAVLQAGQSGPRPTKQMIAACAWKGEIPPALCNRSKTGFSTPVLRWFAPLLPPEERGYRAWAHVVYREAQRSISRIKP